MAGIFPWQPSSRRNHRSRSAANGNVVASALANQTLRAVHRLVRHWRWPGGEKARRHSDRAYGYYYSGAWRMAVAASTYREALVPSSLKCGFRYRLSKMLPFGIDESSAGGVKLPAARERLFGKYQRALAAVVRSRRTAIIDMARSGGGIAHLNAP